MSKWEKSISFKNIPDWQYKLSTAAIEQFGEEECNKGISISGVNLNLNWKNFNFNQERLKDSLYSESKSNGLVDSRRVNRDKNIVTEELIRP